jgi:hypothetical protein
MPDRSEVCPAHARHTDQIFASLGPILGCARLAGGHFFICRRACASETNGKKPGAGLEDGSVLAMMIFRAPRFPDHRWGARQR